MYWRVQKFDPRDVFQRYGVHVVLVMSILLNIFLIATHPSKNQLSSEMKQDFEEFARTVATHLLDTSYISYDSSTSALVGGELSSEVIANLRQQEMLARNTEEQKAMLADLKRSRQISAIRIDDVSLKDLDSQNLMPIEVKGVVAIDSAGDTGPTEPVPFRFAFLVGINQKTNKPVVARFQDLSQRPPS